MGPKETDSVLLEEGRTEMLVVSDDVVVETLSPDLFPEKEMPPSSAASVCSQAASDTPGHPSKVIIESHRRIFGQVAFPFLVAGMGMVGAGVYLDIVQVNKNYLKKLLAIN